MENTKNRLDFRKTNSFSVRTQKQQAIYLNNQHGFAVYFILGLIPILFAAGISVCYAQYLSGNWMQAKHTCRVELLETQKNIAPLLSQLMQLNPRIKKLRIEMTLAKAQRAAAIAMQNPIAEMAAEAKITDIINQQTALHVEQVQLIQIANQQMTNAVYKVRQLLFLQNQKMQNLMPIFFKFKIEDIKLENKELAVIPDSPATPPIYELKYDFINEQTLSVNWKTTFITKDDRTKKWFHVNLKKHDGCAASLEPNNQEFIYRLNEGKY